MIKDADELGIKRMSKLDNSEPFLVIPTMSIDHYYSSITYKQSPMTEDAEALLEKTRLYGIFQKLRNKLCA